MAGTTAKFIKKAESGMEEKQAAVTTRMWCQRSLCEALFVDCLFGQVRGRHAKCLSHQPPCQHPRKRTPQFRRASAAPSVHDLLQTPNFDIASCMHDGKCDRGN